VNNITIACDVIPYSLYDTSEREIPETADFLKTLTHICQTIRGHTQEKEFDYSFR
jgi:hypothetical protein